MFTVLVVEDDVKLNRLFCTALKQNKYEPLSAKSGMEALEILDREVADLIISDIMMPGMDGCELIKTLRDAGYAMPVLIITAKHSFEDKEKGFNAGTDDYMVKPVDVNEMILRVGALLRRAKITNERRIVFGETIIDYDMFTVSWNGNEVLLPQKEFNLLFKLMSYPGVIFTRQQLMDEIWGMFSESDERTVDVHINRLRDRLKECKDLCIATVRGLGYKAVKSP